MNVDFGAFFAQSKAAAHGDKGRCTKDGQGAGETSTAPATSAGVGKGKRTDATETASGARVAGHTATTVAFDEQGTGQGKLKFRRKGKKSDEGLVFDGPEQTTDEAKLRKEIAHVWRLLNVQEDKRAAQRRKGEKGEKGENDAQAGDEDGAEDDVDAEKDGAEEVVDPADVVYEPNKVVVNLGGKFNELDIKNAFEKKCGGQIKNVLIIRAKKGSRVEQKNEQAKTTAFVEFYHNGMCKKALALNGGKLNGAKVGVSLARKKFPKVSPGDTRIFVKNLAYKVSEEILRKVFSPCGTIKDIQVPHFEDSKKPKGFAFISFSNWKEVKNAVRLDRKNVCGREILVEVAHEHQGGAVKGDAAGSAPSGAKRKGVLNGEGSKRAKKSK